MFSSLLLLLLLIFDFPLVITTARIYPFKNSSRHEITTTIRSIRFQTDNSEYRLRCPYNMTNIQIIDVNYSSLQCIQTYIAHYQYEKPICSSIHKTYCLFYTKPIRLDSVSCPFLSDYVDITYQCSSTQIYSPKTKYQKNNYKFSNSKSSTTVISKTITIVNITQHRGTIGYANHLPDNLGVFLIGLSIIGALSLLACCIWLIRCDTKHNDRQHRNDNDYYSERVPLERTPTTVSSSSPHSLLINNQKENLIQINDNDVAYNDLTLMQLNQNDHYCEHCLINNDYYPEGRRYSTILDYKSSSYGLELDGIVGNLTQNTGGSTAQIVENMNNNNNTTTMTNDKNIIRIDEEEPCTCYMENQSNHYNTLRSIRPLTTNSMLSLSRQSTSSQNDSSAMEMYIPPIRPLSSDTTSGEKYNKIFLTTNPFEDVSQQLPVIIEHNNHNQHYQQQDNTDSSLSLTFVSRQYD
ncbi:unnamed protein product [Didymodactylos carnosus]|uniref:SUEL-type lectin domain-containing protein n=1 Tax=Didymodactylos carnosus TaxID=1234261 RepID=A0A814SS55_9BILA|nr:unnamed protein product [Didymodactylos carnosus]CAF3915351.1 unnamed protein product [Didymodactylos carnosus]